MEAKPILWEVPRFIKTFPCFNSDCRKEAKHLLKFMNGDIVVQVCLCADCLKKSPELILKSLRAQAENVVGGGPNQLDSLSGRISSEPPALEIRPQAAFLKG